MSWTYHGIHVFTVPGLNHRQVLNRSQQRVYLVGNNRRVLGQVYPGQVAWIPTSVRIERACTAKLPNRPAQPNQSCATTIPSGASEAQGGGVGEKSNHNAL